MSDLIDRDQAIAAINSRKSYIKPSGPYDEYSEGRYEAYEAAIDELEELPSAEKTGRWIEQNDEYNDTIYQCSVCGEEFVTIEGTPADNLWNYCPNCGADMRKEHENESI